MATVSNETPMKMDIDADAMVPPSETDEYDPNIDLTLNDDLNDPPNSSIDEMPNNSASFNTLTLDDSEDDTNNPDNEANQTASERKLNFNSTIYELKTFPLCEKFYGKEVMEKAIATVRNLEFFIAEMNYMFGAVEDRIKDQKLANQTTNNQNIKKVQKSIRGYPVSTENYTTFDLRVNIGDALQADLQIPDYKQNSLFFQIDRLLSKSQLAAKGLPFNSQIYVNNILVLECRDADVFKYVTQHMLLDIQENWGDDANFVLLPRKCERKIIEICVPYFYENVAEVLEIIKKQNRLPVDEWQLKSTEKWADGNGMNLNVEIDGGSYLRLVHDQDDLHVLLKRAIVRLPVEEASTLEADLIAE